MAFNSIVTSGIFSFAGDSLFVKSSGNLHRRATVPELHEHFDHLADQPAHWYDAQLIHYGLPSSRVKGTAKMRLYDAFKRGHLIVPEYIRAMEIKLSKTWKDQQKQIENTHLGPTTAATRKRKSEPQEGQRSTKHRKSSVGPSSKSETYPVVSLSVESGSTHTTFKTGWAASPDGPTRNEATDPVDPIPALRTPKISRRGEEDLVPDYYTRAPEIDGHHHFTGNHFTQQSCAQYRPYADGPFHDAIDDDRKDGIIWDVKISDVDDDKGNDDDRTIPPRLGLINGTYVIHENDSDQSVFQGGTIPPPGRLILTLDQGRLWGSLELTNISGILLRSRRPYRAGEERLPITWGGYHIQPSGTRRFWDGTLTTSRQYLCFRGNGQIRGSVRYGNGRDDFHEFWGYRVSGEEMRSEISPWEMRSRWEDTFSAVHR